jgi:hypothetical protein
MEQIIEVEKGYLIRSLLRGMAIQCLDVFVSATTYTILT